MNLADYAVGDVVHEGSETRVCRAIHRPSGNKVVIKLPAAAAPISRVKGRIMHEHQILIQLEAVAGVVRSRELLHQGGVVGLVLEDPGLESLDRLLERGRLPVE